MKRSSQVASNRPSSAPVSLANCFLVPRTILGATLKHAVEFNLLHLIQSITGDFAVTEGQD